MSSSIHPLPSSLLLLNNLPSQPPGTKVRFLGCVVKYSTKTGLLALEHPHHGEERKTRKMVVALVDIKIVRGRIKSTDTMRGAWVNVVGYIQQEQKQKEKGKGVRVQALMLWSAEGVKLGEYERAVAERQKLG